MVNKLKNFHKYFNKMLFSCFGVYPVISCFKNAHQKLLFLKAIYLHEKVTRKTKMIPNKASTDLSKISEKVLRILK